jgi:hypothetical protein
MSPAIQNAVGNGPSPAKKKMSLKDYTKRKQAEAAATPTSAVPLKDGEEEAADRILLADGDKVDGAS